MELFENTDVTASIYKPLEHALGFWGSRQGMLFICFRISNIIAFSCGQGYFETLLVWTGILLHTDEKDAFSKLSGYVWTGP